MTEDCLRSRFASYVTFITTETFLNYRNLCEGDSEVGLTPSFAGCSEPEYNLFRQGLW